MASHNMSLDELNDYVIKLKDDLDNLSTTFGENVDQFFLITMGIIIYLMQAGFAFLEAGAVRSKNTVNILIKNALDSFFGGVSYWLFGYAFAFGEGNAYIGYEHFAHSNLPDSRYAHWFFQFVFAATAATIVSGAVAERCEFIAYIIYSSIITGFIYPVVTHWTWSPEGWLAEGKEYKIDDEDINPAYIDFAGSGVVHMVGGLAALIGALALGPRIGRFDPETRRPVPIKGHSLPLASLGGFILVFGFFAFNGSSQGAISNEGDGEAVAIAVKNTVVAASGGAFTTLLLNKTPYFGDNKWSFLSTLNGCLTGMGDGEAVAIAVKNTVVAASGGAFTTLLLNKTPYFGDNKWSFLSTLNGCLTGMVAICAGCNQFYTYTAFVTGVVGGLVYMISTWVVLKLKIDDPLDAFAVHYGGGAWGAVSVPLFSIDYGVVYNWDKKSAYYLAWQLAGMAAITGWTAILSVIMFFTLKFARLLRVPREYEMKGLDIPKHGEAAYPAESYGHGWGETGQAVEFLAEKAVITHAASMDLSVGFEEKHEYSESPELDAIRRRNGHLNPAFSCIKSPPTENLDTPPAYSDTKM